MSRRLTLVLAAALLAWSVAIAVDGVQRARQRPADDRPRAYAELETLAASLPPRGSVGFVQAGEPAQALPRAIHIAQYVLAPRVVMEGAGAEFVIGHIDAEYDDRWIVDGYTEVGAAGPWRVFRRTQTR
jgi:hypothetical protein